MTDRTATPDVAELERRLQEARSRLERVKRRTDDGRIERRADPGRARLSFTQEQLWFLDALAPGRTTYLIPVMLRLTGPLDTEALAGAVSALAARHEPLRTTFAVEDGTPYQLVHPPQRVDVPVIDLGDVGDGEREQALRDAVRREVARPFDLARDHLLRVRLIRLADEEHVLCLTMHHICFDGYSGAVVVEELATLYESARDGTPADLPELPIQFGDFAEWQQRRHAAGAMDADLDYWAERLRDAPTLDLPSDRPRPELPSYRGERVTYTTAPEALEGLRALARDSGATLFATLVAALNATLSRWTGSDDVVVGTASPGRHRPALERLVGVLINMVVLRTDLSGDPPFREVVRRTMETVSGAWDHQEAPFEKVVERLGIPRDPSRNPLFQIAMDLQQGEAFEWKLPGLTVEPLTVDVESARFDLAINTYETAQGLLFRVEFSTDLFDRSRIVRLLGQLERAMLAVARDPDLRVSELPLLDDGERELLLEGWQGAQAEQSREPVHVQVARVAAASPEAVAARADGVELSYGELDRRAGLVARRLRGLGVEAGDVVAVALGRGPELLVALLGVLKAGGAFVVVDPSHPPKRLEFILTDTSARAVLTSAGAAGRLPVVEGCEVVRLDEEREALEALASEPLEEWADEGSLAYVLYTSGSTGTPKGVLVEHHALSTFLLWMGGYVGPGDRVAQHMALIFDFAVGEIFTAMTRGATLVFVPEADRLVPEAIGALIERERITYLGGPPAILGAIPRGEYPSLRAMIIGGEAFGGELVNRWNTGDRRFVNGYGPTEAAVGCISYECEHRHWDAPPPIGRAMPRRVAYVLDRFDQLCPVGVPGEVVVGGAGLARGYLNLPELTAERFVPDPFRPGERIYRTGDLGVWTEEGQIQFLGRIDTQVKLNGLRIELEEIESALVAHPRVEAAAAAVCEPRAGLKQLVGYVVTGGDGVPDEQLRDHLADSLPRYMIPTAFVTLEQLPLTPVGKIDRKALPAPEADHGPGEHVEPRTETEKAVATVFAQILGRDQIGAGDNFFTLGGTSLQAARAVIALRDATGADVPLTTLYQHPTVGQLAAAIDAGEAAEVQTRDVAAAAREAIGEGELPPRAPNRGREVLLTGVTGFFGAFLLDELLRQGCQTVHCLVRAADEDEAWTRLRERLARHDLGPDDLEARVVPVRGDLGAPRLGLGEEAFAALAERVDSIYHCGAHVDVLFTYDHLEQVNVGGTAELVALASTGVLKELHFVSSVSARVGAQADPASLGYAVSKFQAERVLLEARERGVPVTVFRLPRIAADTRTARSNERDVIVKLVTRFLEMGIAPALEFEEDWIPADEAARLLVATAGAHPDGGLFEIASGERVPIRRVIELAAGDGRRVAVRDTETFLAEIEERFPDDREVMGTVLANAPRRPSGGNGATRPAPPREGPAFETVRARGVDDELLRRYVEALAERTVGGRR